MGPEAIPNHIDEIPPAPQQPQQLKTLEKKDVSDTDRKAIDKGEKSTERVDIESTYVEERAKKLLAFAKKENKLSKKQTDQYEQQLSQTENRESREEILSEIQKQISTIHTDKDRSDPLEKDDPEREKLQKNYHSLLKEHEHLLGTDQLKKYKEWFDQQNPTIENLEKQTIALLQAELPKRRVLFNKLKDKLNKYGIQNPTEIAFIAREGYSERQTFLSNIEKLEDHFEQYKGIREKLYSKKTERTLMEKICRAPDLQSQEHMWQRPKFLESQEHNKYAQLERAVRSGQISQKSMDDMLDYYKNISDWTKRAENLNLWEGFVETERKLETDLEKVFEEEPANKEGLELARKIFKDKNFVEKQDFIEQMKQQRKTEESKEEQNRSLLIQNFKHAIDKACTDKNISPKTADRYKEWIDKKAKGASATEVEQYLEILTSNIANKDAKNLKAYKEAKDNFLADLKRLQELNPQLSKEDIQKWETEYTSLGWEKREKKHNELNKEIDKEKSRRIKETPTKQDQEQLQTLESQEQLSNPEADKETALLAIHELMENALPGSALTICTILKMNHPEDDKIQDLHKELKALANGMKAKPEEKEVTKKQLDENTEIKGKAEELQTEAIAYDLMEENQQRHENLTSAKDRTQKAVDHKTAGKESLKRINKAYLDESKDGKILDDKTLKGRKAVKIKTDTKISKNETRTLRKEVQKEQDKRDHGGSSAIEFENARTGKKLEKRQAKLDHEARRDALAEEMAERTAKTISPGQKTTATQKAEAKEEALEQLKQKEQTRIERMA